MSTSPAHSLVLCLGLILSACSSNVLGGNDSQGPDPSDPSLAGLDTLRIEPQGAVLAASPGAPAIQAYKAIGRFPDQSERDVTAVVRFSLLDPSLGMFQSETLTSASWKGGRTQVAVSSRGGVVLGMTGLTVRFTASVRGPDGGQPLPADPGKSFQGTASAARAPTLVYPNAGVMLPPNLRRLEVHFLPGPAQNRLFEIAFLSAVADIRTYVRCASVVNSGCIVELDPQSYGYVAESNRGGEPARLLVRGGDDSGGGFGESAAQEVSFAEANVEGGLYYWTTSGDTAIMRFDFGGQATTPEVFLSPKKNGFPVCVGCHTLSRDGSKLVASLGGQGDGRIVYLADLGKPNTFTLKGDDKNTIQFASFDPTGGRFAAVYGDANTLHNRLWIHDGTTGLRLPAESVDLPFEPDHPDWAPSGDQIAVTRVGIHNTSQRPYKCGIELLGRSGASFGSPVTLMPIAPGVSRYNPNFAPDSSFLVFSESLCPGGQVQSDACDGDADDVAKTWAILPRPGAAPVLLRQAGAPGVMDHGATDLADTFPRFSPFQEKQRGGRLFWVTISSRRKAGLRDPAGRQLLWMFAIDPAQVAAGKDGSSPAFFLPFQDLGTSNHIGQWTTKIVPPLG